MTLHFVEDFIEYLYGSLDKDGNPLQIRGYYTPPNPVKLASYDRSPVTSMGSFCHKARTEKMESCLTDKQVDLAKKIVFKYRRQMLTLGVVLPEDESSLSTRFGVRAIDRSKFLKNNENRTVSLKFPYDPRKINTLHDYTTKSAGQVEWNNTSKIWNLDLTEGNLCKILELFKDEDLKIDDSLVPFVSDIFKATPADLPTFRVTNARMELVNCHPGVEEYLRARDWEPTDIANLPYWIGQATTLGLQLDAGIDELLNDHSPMVASIIKNMKVTLPSGNQPDGEWFDSLLAANHLLDKSPWLLYLTWWTEKTNWTQFKNITKIPNTVKNNFRVDQSFSDIVNSSKDPIIVVDSVIGRDSVRNFIENNALKVIYISDIGQSV